jgi:hypothetical protein
MPHPFIHDSKVENLLQVTLYDFPRGYVIVFEVDFSVVHQAYFDFLGNYFLSFRSYFAKIS